MLRDTPINFREEIKMMNGRNKKTILSLHTWYGIEKVEKKCEKRRRDKPRLSAYL